MSRPFTILECEQRSPEWFQARLGLLTGSCANDVIAERKRGTGPLQCWIDLRRRLACERITGLSADFERDTFDMQRGREMEPLALAEYEARTGLALRRVGFVRHVEYSAGCSLDAFAGEWEGAVEVKCPRSTTHMAYLLGGTLPEDYRGQVLHTFWITGVPWIDFVSYDDRFPAGLDLFVRRVERNDFDVMAYGRTALRFLAEVEDEVKAVNALRHEQVA